MNLTDLTNRGVITPAQLEILKPFQSAKAGDAHVPKPPALSREKLWVLAPASVEIVTELLDGVDKSPGQTTLPERWLARIAKLLWMFVEATVPRRPFFIAFRYWFQVFFTITAVVLLLTFFGVWEGALPMAAKVMAGLVGIYTLTEIIRGVIARKWDVILSTVGIVTAASGGVVLLYQRVVNGVDLGATSAASTRFTWTLFVLLLLPGAYSILEWVLRRLFFRSGAAKLIPLGARPSSLQQAWTTIKVWGSRAVLLAYALCLLAVAAYLILNPKEVTELKTKTVPVTVEEPIPTRKQSNSERKVQEIVDSAWNRLGH